MHSLVIKETPSCLWLNKPAGIPVFRPHTDPNGDCLLARLLAARPAQHADFPTGFEGGIVHRLDVSTSGAVLAVKGPEHFASLRALFTDKRLVKTYRFLSNAQVPWIKNEVLAAIGHDKRRKKRMVVQRGKTTPHRGKWYPAKTHFRHIEGRLWEAVITTGVMHQIRAHAAFVGIPLAGDKVYGGGDLGCPKAPEDVLFALHHLGLAGGDLPEVEAALPEWFD